VTESLQSATAALDRVLSETRRVLGTLDAPHDSPTADARRGTGEAADGRVQAVVVSPNELGALHLDSAVRDLPAEELASYVLTAVNAAFADFTAQAAASREVVPADPAVLAHRLREVQEESMRNMAALCTAMTDALLAVRTAARP
jgi:DNA-binding protein YbaB